MVSLEAATACLGALKDDIDNGVIKYPSFYSDALSVGLECMQEKAFKFYKENGIDIGEMYEQ